MAPISERRPQSAVWHLRHREVSHGMDPPCTHPVSNPTRQGCRTTRGAGRCPRWRGTFVNPHGERCCAPERWDLRPYCRGASGASVRHWDVPVPCAAQDSPQEYRRERDRGIPRSGLCPPADGGGDGSVGTTSPGSLRSLSPHPVNPTTSGGADQSVGSLGMAIVGISHKVRLTLSELHGSGDDPITKAAFVERLAAEVLELAEAVERLSIEVDGLIDGRGRYSAGPPRS